MISVLLTSFAFGWAKPTPVNPRNLRGGRWGEAMVAAAGPVSNLVLAIAACDPAPLHLRDRHAGGPARELPGAVHRHQPAADDLQLHPIPPLDGSKVLFAFLNPRTAWQVRPILEQYGFYILLILIVPLFGGVSLLGTVIGAVIRPLYSLLTGL